MCTFIWMVSAITSLSQPTGIMGADEYETVDECLSARTRLDERLRSCPHRRDVNYRIVYGTIPPKEDMP